MVQTISDGCESISGGQAYEYAHMGKARRAWVGRGMAFARRGHGHAFHGRLAMGVGVRGVGRP